MAYRTMDRPTFGGSLRLGASPLSLYSSKNRSDSLPEVPSLPFKIYEVAMKAWRIVKCCDTQFHVKDARKMPSSGEPLLGIFSDDVGNLIRLQSISVHLRCQTRQAS